MAPRHSAIAYGMSKYDRPNQAAFLKPCRFCSVGIRPGQDEQLHLRQFHQKESVLIGELLWITPHEVIYAGRHYKPAKL